MDMRPTTSADAAQIYRIWQSTLGFKWPISESTLVKTLDIDHQNDNCISLGFWHGSSLLGIAFTEIITDKSTAALTLLAIDPTRHRRGIATSLVHELSTLLRARGIISISLGAGASKLLWHGVPKSLPNACRFFQKIGFVFDETSYDLIQNISEFQIPPEVVAAQKTHQFEIEILSPKMSSEMLCFEREHFPDWHRYFEQAVGENRFLDILLARRGEEILGSVLLSIAPQCPGGHWMEFLGPNLGAFGIVGVAPTHRNHGVGLALAAQATQILRDRGIQNCFLHWTWLREWYGKLGYKVWEEYQMGKLTVGS